MTSRKQGEGGGSHFCDFCEGPRDHTLMASLKQGGGGLNFCDIMCEGLSESGRV